VVKLNLISPVLDVLFPIICDISSSDDEEDTAEAADDDDAQSPSSCALQVTDYCLSFTALTYV